MLNPVDLVRRVYLRFALTKDPKTVSKEFAKLRDALKTLETAYVKHYDLSEGANFHAYSQAIDSWRAIKFFLEHAGGAASSKAIVTLSKNPFDPSKAVAENAQVFKDALDEVDALEKEFEQTQKAAA